MSDFEDVRAAQRDLVLSKLSLAVLFAPIETQAISTIEDPTNGELATLTGYTGAGIIEKDAGLSITNDIDSSDIEGYGEIEPVRTIIKSRKTSFNASFIETNRQVIEKYWGVNLDSSNLTVSAHGGTTVKAPPRPKNIHYRCILIGQDDVNGFDLYPYWILPKVKLSEVDNMDLKDDGPIEYRMTFQAFKDAGLGASVIQGWCGPGWRKLIDKSGFVSPPTAIDVTATGGASVAEGATKQLVVTADNGINRTPDATFSSATPAKATVDSSGLVTGVAAGTSVITATYQPPSGSALTDTITITVTGP